MAATRLIAMHANKGSTVAECLKLRLDYSMNPEKTEDGQLVFLYENIEYRDRGEMKIPVTDQLLQDLTDLYKSLRLAEWDGFSRYNTLERDGYSFTLSISFADGKDMSARGENVFPERYKEFKAKLKEIFGPLCEEAVGKE